MHGREKVTSSILFSELLRCLVGVASLHTFIFVDCSPSIEATRTTLPSSRWQRQRAKGFYKFLTPNLPLIREWMVTVPNTRCAVEGQRSGVMSGFRPIRDSYSANA